MELEDDRRGPGLRFPPPLIPLAIIAAAYLLHRVTPLPLGSSRYLWIAGIGLVVGAALLAIAALLQFRREQTHVEPWHPTTTIIQHGLYARSRNPIYLSFCIATAGIGLWLNSWWVLAGLPLQIYLLQSQVIRREETYLEAKFGDSYRDYRKRVRRWL